MPVIWLNKKRCWS